jgi:hypothetical protein
MVRLASRPQHPSRERSWPLASVELDVPVDVALREWVRFRERRVASDDAVSELVPDHTMAFDRLDAWRSRVTVAIEVEPQVLALGRTFGPARSAAANELARFRAFVEGHRARIEATDRHPDKEDDHGLDQAALPRPRGASPGPGHAPGHVAGS